MTINSDVRVAGPFTATGASQVLPFTFRIFSPNDVIVVVTDLAGVDITLINQSGFSVSMNVDQDTSPGGTVTITSTLNFKLLLSTALANTQPVQITNGGPFNASVITAGLDRIVVLIQQAVNAATRSLRLPISDGAGVSGAIPSVAVRGSKFLAFDASGNVTVSNLTITELENQPASAAASALSAANSAAQVAADKLLVDADRIAAENAAAVAQAAAAGMDWKASVRAATTANITLSGAQTIDGVAVIAGDRVLVKDQSTAANNGIYVVASGVWARATDMDSWLEVPSATVSVEEGTANADRAFICTANAGGTLGTTAISWSAFGAGYTGGNFSVTGELLVISKIATGQYMTLGVLASDPAIPENGNIWSKATGFFVRFGGAIKQLATTDQLFTDSAKLTTDVAQPIPNSAQTTINWKTEAWDDIGLHDLVTNPDRVPVNWNGRVKFDISFGLNTVNNMSRFQMFLIKNGAVEVARRSHPVPASGDQPQTIEMSEEVTCANGDYFQVQIFQNSGGSENTNVSETVTNLKYRRSK